MLKVNGKWRYAKNWARTCSHCGARLIPYLPHCVKCHTMVPAILQELEYQDEDLAKPQGATRIAHLSDIHIGFNLGSRTSPVAVLRIWLERFAEQEVDILIVSGDLIERPGDRYGLLMAHALLENFPGISVVVPGNHDIKRPGHPDFFFEVFGEFPRVEVHKGIEFVLFDSMAGLPLEERDVAERMYGDYVCYTEGRVGEFQYLLMQEDIKSKGLTGDQRFVVLHHHVMRQHADLMPHVPKQAKVTEDLFGTMKSLLDADRLFDWCDANGVSMIFHGHKHVFMQPGMRGGNVVILNAGSSTLHEGLQRGRIVDVLPDGDRRILNLELHI